MVTTKEARKVLSQHFEQSLPNVIFKPESVFEYASYTVEIEDTFFYFAEYPSGRIYFQGKVAKRDMLKPRY